MNDNVRKVFDMLGVEPNEEFKIKGLEKKYCINENLSIIYKSNKSWGYDSSINIGSLLCSDFIIIKLPKIKKLRDWILEDFKKWESKNCDGDCEDCLFGYVGCDSRSNQCWVINKDLYSDKFLDQEIEVEE